ncbi:MAG: hypothetical protein JRN68_04425 [Nitrososphaerota archaeon]|nr:hypothetical protein [Ferrimicrobium acidiphilum]MDG6933922.1 hypothetical protein [Nitrososphaerota archaeon]
MSKAFQRKDEMVVVIKIRGRDRAGRFMSYADLKKSLGERGKRREKLGGLVGKLLSTNKTRVKLSVYRPAVDKPMELSSWDVTHYWLAN